MVSWLVSCVDLPAVPGYLKRALVGCFTLLSTQLCSFSWLVHYVDLPAVPGCAH